MNTSYIFTSMTRISDLQHTEKEIVAIEKSRWAAGDYVLCKVLHPHGGKLKIELPSGRMMALMKGDLVIGALGHRYATLEATGSWEKVEIDGRMHLLTGAGLMGKLTSKSVGIPDLIEIQYLGHVKLKNGFARMGDYVKTVPIKKMKKPIVLLVGTSMSAGKTTAARIISRQLRAGGYKIVGAKLTGAGRYRDILSVKDAGANYIFDFVDVGLPSTICRKGKYLCLLKILLSRIADTDADIAVFEIGASPLEPYNGDIAIAQIADQIKCIVLCASDPYAVYGVMKSFNMTPDLVSGIATNTLAGIDLIEKLTGVRAINIINQTALPELRQVLEKTLGIPPLKTEFEHLNRSGMKSSNRRYVANC